MFKAMAEAWGAMLPTGTPLFVLLGLAGWAFAALAGFPGIVVPQRIAMAANSFPLLLVLLAITLLPPLTTWLPGLLLGRCVHGGASVRSPPGGKMALRASRWRRCRRSAPWKPYPTRRPGSPRAAPNSAGLCIARLGREH